MNERDRQFFALYEKQRFTDQQRFYRSRRDEFQGASSEATKLTVALLVLTAIVSSLGNVSAVPQGWKPFLAILGVALPALSTALAAYTGLYMFDQLAKLYGDAMHALGKAATDAPSPDAGPSGEADTALLSYVQAVEGVLRAEQAQWGQLIHQLKLPDLATETKATPTAPSPPPAPGSPAAPDPTAEPGNEG